MGIAYEIWQGAGQEELDEMMTCSDVELEGFDEWAAGHLQAQGAMSAEEAAGYGIPHIKTLVREYLYEDHLWDIKGFHDSFDYEYGSICGTHQMGFEVTDITWEGEGDGPVIEGWAYGAELASLGGTLEVYHWVGYDGADVEMEIDFKTQHLEATPFTLRTDSGAQVTIYKVQGALPIDYIDF